MLSAPVPMLRTNLTATVVLSRPKQHTEFLRIFYTEEKRLDLTGAGCGLGLNSLRQMWSMTAWRICRGATTILRAKVAAT